MTATSFDPRTGTQISTAPATSESEVRDLLKRASASAERVAQATPAQRRDWLYSIADAMEFQADELVAIADRETGLGRARLDGEVLRTAAQIRFYGDVAAEGSYLSVTRDEGAAGTDRLVRVNRPLGPVAVFGASNFPFVFGVLGHDTSAALAAGCPVLVKAHTAHIALSHRLAELAQTALSEAGAPEGSFGMVVGRAAGVQLVKAPEVTAVAFTGSQSGGLALWRISNERDRVIPVYAEMGTVNPVVVTEAGATDMQQLAKDFVGSFTLGSGQYCTKPGLMLAPFGSDAAARVASALETLDPRPLMLTEGIAGSVKQGLVELRHAGARTVVELGDVNVGWSAPAAVLQADISSLSPGSRLLEECFGPVVLVCEYSSQDELLAALTNLQPSLAASLIAATEGADPQAPALLQRLSEQVGRVVVNGWPTGASCSWGQQHGGPWPSTSNPGVTSIGAAALNRFVRPVAFQDVPDEWLPPEAQQTNPYNVPRRVNGILTPAPN